MVAEDRFNLFLRLDSPTFIDLGNWQVELKQAISEYLKFEPPETANEQEIHLDKKPTSVQAGR